MGVDLSYSAMSIPEVCYYCIGLSCPLASRGTCLAFCFIPRALDGHYPRNSSPFLYLSLYPHQISPSCSRQHTVACSMGTEFRVCSVTADFMRMGSCEHYCCVYRVVFGIHKAIVVITCMLCGVSCMIGSCACREYRMGAQHIILQCVAARYTVQYHVLVPYIAVRSTVWYST